MSKQTELYVWNVENGTAIYARTPNGKNVVIDCGASDVFSPIKHINNKLKIQEIDDLIISHPHKDHINDLKGLEDHYGHKGNDGLRYNITLLMRNKAITPELMIKSNEKLKGDEDLDRYFKLSCAYNGRGVEGEKSPSHSDWGGGCVFNHFLNTDPGSGNVNNSTINDMSVVTFVTFGNDTILYGGDVEKAGWKKILRMPGFKKLLKKTTIYIASHHGNKSGFSSELFEDWKPKLTIVSSSKKRDYDATVEYNYHTTGMDVFKDGECEQRKVVTTRKDGHIHVTLYGDSGPTVELGCPPKT